MHHLKSALTREYYIVALINAGGIAAWLSMRYAAYLGIVEIIIATPSRHDMLKYNSSCYFSVTLFSCIILIIGALMRFSQAAYRYRERLPT